MNATPRAVLRALVLIASAAGAARATAPNVLTYQGRLKESGLPVTGVRSVDVQICAAPTGACASTTVQSVAVANGLFRTTFTVPSGVSLETGAWFLEVQVGGAAFGPREMLSAAAYAIYASSASTLIANPGDPAVFVSPSVVIAGSGFSVGGSTFVVSGGNVGVGTASPGSALEVKGQLTLSGAGHLRASGAGASLPATGACGAGATIAGGDAVGRVTIGAGGPSSCQIVFGTPWGPNVPVCHFTNESGNAQAYAVGAADSFSVTFQAGGALTSGDVVGYACSSY